MQHLTGQTNKLKMVEIILEITQFFLRHLFKNSSILLSDFEQVAEQFDIPGVVFGDHDFVKFLLSLACLCFITKLDQ